MELLDLNKLIAEDKRLFEPWLPKQVELQVNLAPRLPLIQGDRQQLQRIMMDLLVHGVIATAFTGNRRGIVTLATGVETIPVAAHRLCFINNMAPNPGNYVSLSVCDGGDGLDDAVLTRLADSRFSVRTLQNLDLLSLLRIVKAHNGGIQVKSCPGKNTTFKVFFPIVKAYTSRLIERTAPSLVPA